MFPLFPLLVLLLLTFSGCGAAKHSASSLAEPFEAEPIIRVLILEEVPKIEFIPLNGYQLITSDGYSDLPVDATVTLERIPGGMLRVSVPGQKPQDSEWFRIVPVAGQSFPEVRIPNVPYGQGWWWANEEDRFYTGIMAFHPHGEEGINAIVHLPVEEYLRGVVPSEIGREAPTEALKAQAVAARSETVVSLRKGAYKGPEYDICSTVQCQVYAGTRRSNEAVDAAILATRGEVLSHQGKPVAAYYASNSGGHTEHIENVWSARAALRQIWRGNPDTLEPISQDLTNHEQFAAWVRSAPPAYANRATFPELPEWTQKNYRWERIITVKEFSEQIAKKQNIGTVQQLIPGTRGISGRLMEIELVGESGRLTVKDQLEIRRMIAPPLRSSAFIVETGKNEAGELTFIFIGAGYGHGVGMCQTGAMGRALSGQTYRQILAHYYRETEVVSAYGN